MLNISHQEMQIKASSHPLEWLQSERLMMCNLVKDEETGTPKHGWWECTWNHIHRTSGKSLKS